VSTILHLSDLHLGGTDAWERRTDDKVGVVPRDENARLSVLSTSLQAVKRYLEDRGTELDALVVSGDITSRHDTVGFERFAKVLDDVSLAPPDRILVVPGNHDVDWQEQPGTTKKYAKFLEYTRARSMRTPLCDGVDFVGDPADCDAAPVLPLKDCVLVAVNSANWCGVRLGDPPDDEEIFDVARVSEPQLDRLTDILRTHDTAGLVRIAVLHHHLLPVTEDEEARPYESFTNLARLRGWLREHQFHAVLHGHKHRPVITWDHVYELGDHEKPARRMLVVSAPTPTSWGAPLCRLIRTGASSGRRPVLHAPRLALETVRAERHERTIEPEHVSVPLDDGRPELPALVSIDALTADAAYERLVHELESRAGTLLNVTCVVRDPKSAEHPPTNWPPQTFANEIEEPEDWIADALSWWQHRSPALVAAGEAPFNHGERLYASRTGKGALDLAAERLGSTKAMVLLLRESELRAGGEAPAFVAVQLVRAADEQGDRLDCVGYFRKQDLTLWWPVNIAELRRIQEYVLDLPAAKRLRAGRLVTIATEAIYDNVLPELAGTLVDRAVDLRPELLMKMAYGVAHASSENRDDVLQLWTSVLRDIGSQRETDAHRDFPSLGIERLLEHLRVFRDVGGKDYLQALIRRLEAVSDRAHRAKRESQTRSERMRHSHDLFEMVGEVLAAVDEAMANDLDHGS
jgi:predicted phosphodiesterase